MAEAGGVVTEVDRSDEMLEWYAEDDIRDGATAEHGSFWDQRDSLRHIHEFAQARIVGPWGVLGSLMVRATCAVPPHITLPAITGGPMSLNMFCAPVGASGVGKGGCDAVAREAARFSYGGRQCELLELPTGSGEGIARSLRQADADEDDEQPDTVLFSIPEVQTVAALFSRQGSTLESELRKVFSGEQLGFTNSQKSTRTRVAAHSYRAGMIIGVQPLHADALLKGADGGTPQRILWMPVDDPDAPDEDQDQPAPIMVAIPAIVGPHLDIPPSVRDEIRSSRRAVMRREPVDPLDGHRLLTRLKVAVALMLLDQRSEFWLDDWGLAAQVMAVSDETRAGIARMSADRSRRDNAAKALSQADRDVVILDRLAEESQHRVSKAIIRKLERTGTATRYDLRSACDSSIRADFTTVFDLFLDKGFVVGCEGVDGHSQEYRLAAQ
jgi:hypothetical protein